MASVQGGQAKVGGFTPTAGQQRAVSGGAQGHWALQGGPAESHCFRAGFQPRLGHKHSQGGWGGHPLTFPSSNPVQSVVVDGAPGSTTVGIMEGDGTPAACSNHQEGKGGTPTQDTGGKILLNGCPPPVAV